MQEGDTWLCGCLSLAYYHSYHDRVRRCFSALLDRPRCHQHGKEKAHTWLSEGAQTFYCGFTWNPLSFSKCRRFLDEVRVRSRGHFWCSRPCKWDLIMLEQRRDFSFVVVDVFVKPVLCLLVRGTWCSFARLFMLASFRLPACCCGIIWFISELLSKAFGWFLVTSMKFYCRLRLGLVLLAFYYELCS